MRSAYKTSFFSLVLMCLTAQAQQKTNPHTQIAWPANCNSDPHLAYNWQANTCVHVGPVGNTGEVQINQGGAWYSLPGFGYDFTTNTLTAPNLAVPGTTNISVPPAQVSWPPSCATGVYAPATNTCVPTGTANNPAPPTGALQMNSGGIFGPVNNSSADISGNVALPSLRPGVTPFSDIRHPAYGAACNGTNDDGPATQLAINAAMGPGVAAVSITSPGAGQTNGTYTANAGGGGGTGAQIQYVISGGAITSVSILNPGGSYTSTPTFTVQTTTGTKGAIVVTSMSASGGGVVYIPDGCYWANASNLYNPSGNQLTFQMQGTLNLGSTFVLPKGAAVFCQGKGANPQFTTGSATCNINAPQVYGTLGTAITTANTASTVTPVFDPGAKCIDPVTHVSGPCTTASTPVGSAITIAGNMTCNIASVQRIAADTGCTWPSTSSCSGPGPYPSSGIANTVVTFASACRIPAAAKLIIAGVSDPSFNGTFFSYSSDFPAQTLTYKTVGPVTTVNDGTGTITGFNLDSFETARVEAVAGNSVTIHTSFTHSASDYIGAVGVTNTYFDLRYKVIKGININHFWGAGFWGDATAMVQFDGTTLAGAQQWLTSIPLEMSVSWGWTFEHSGTASWSWYQCPEATYACGNIGPPFNVLQDMLPSSLFSSNTPGSGTITDNSTVQIGIYTTCGATSGCYETGPVINGSVLEQPMWNGITFDNRNNGQIYQTTIRDSLLQDNAANHSTAAWVGMTDAASAGAGPRRGNIAFFNNSNMVLGGVGILPTTVNKYWCGQVSVSGQSEYSSMVWPACPEATVTFNDGNSIVGEMNTPQTGFTPIPYPTKPVVPTAAWGCNNITGSGCTVTPGIADPFGGTNAAHYYSGTGFSYSTVINLQGQSTHAGDVFLYGVMYRMSDSLALPKLLLQTFSANNEKWDVLDTGAYRASIINGGWRPLVGMSICTTGDTASHPILFYAETSGNAPNTSADFSMPFAIFIPASDNIPMDMIQMWRTQMLHGYVPSNLPGGAMLATAPNTVLWWGNDTNLYRQVNNATISQIGISGTTLTVVAPNTFHNGQMVSFSGVGTNTFLNSSVPLPIISATSTQFTATISHAAVTLAADTGTATVGGIVRTDGDISARAFLVNNSYGTSGQYLQSTGNGSAWVNGSASEPGNTYDFSPSAVTGGISCSGTNPYTCTLPPLCNLVNYDIISGGSGGGSGGVQASSTNAAGGGGGAPGEYQKGVVPCSFFGGPGASITVTVGAGGNGGAAQAGTSANGTNGAGGGLSRVIGPAGYGLITTQGGAGASYGSGGTTSTGAGGTQSPNLSTLAICVGAAGTITTGGNASCQTVNSGSAGGAGGGGLTAGTPAAGGIQSTASTAQSLRGPAYAAASVTGGTAGGGNGQTPAYNVTPLVLFIYSALGGTGGGANCSGNGGTGGNGMEPGGGGGGGGASCNGFSSGAGGNGGPGHVRLVVE